MAFRRSSGRVRADRAFAQVVATCAGIPRRGQGGTWITAEMQDAYVELHRLGHAHSIEAYDGDELVGGLYGVAIGRMFFGESMFSTRPDGSKVAIAGLAHVLHARGWPLIDAQVGNAHLESLGVEFWPRPRFLDAVAELTAAPPDPQAWTLDLPASELAGSG